MIRSSKNLKQSGAAHLFLVIGAVVALVGILGFVGYSVWQKQSSNAGNESTVGKTSSDVTRCKVTVKNFKAGKKAVIGLYIDPSSSLEKSVKGFGSTPYFARVEAEGANGKGNVWLKNKNASGAQQYYHDFGKLKSGNYYKGAFSLYVPKSKVKLTTLKVYYFADNGARGTECFIKRNV